MHNMHNPPGNDQQISPLFRSAWFEGWLSWISPLVRIWYGSFLEGNKSRKPFSKRWPTRISVGEKWGDSNCPHHRGRSEVSNKKTTFPRGIGPPPMKGAPLGPPWQKGVRCQAAAWGSGPEVIVNNQLPWNLKQPLGWTHGNDRKWLGSAGVFSPTYGTKSTYLYRGELTQLLSTSRTSRHGSGKYISYTWAIQKKILNLNWFGHLDRIPNAESYILRWPTGGNRSL